MNWKKKLSKAISAMKLLNPYENTNLDKLLQPVDDLALESGSEVSDISDIFGEFHQESFLRPNVVEGKKYLTKNEADWKIIEKFTDEFKKTTETVRKELGISDRLFDEEDAIEEALKTRKSFHIKREPRKREEAIIIKRKISLRSNSGSSTESKTWRLLKANRNEKFVVSSPLFHAFQGKEKHWLQRPDISWNVIENSRIKCEEWMSSNI